MPGAADPGPPGRLVPAPTTSKRAKRRMQSTSGGPRRRQQGVSRPSPGPKLSPHHFWTDKAIARPQMAAAGGQYPRSGQALSQADAAGVRERNPGASSARNYGKEPWGSMGAPPMRDKCYHHTPPTVPSKLQGRENWTIYSALGRSPMTRIRRPGNAKDQITSTLCRIKTGTKPRV